MELMSKILEVAKANRKKIVLPEGNEERTIVAVEKIKKEGVAYPILIGNKEEILENFNKNIYFIENVTFFCRISFQMHHNIGFDDTGKRPFTFYKILF